MTQAAPSSSPISAPPASPILISGAFGWLHPTGRAGDTGVVIVAPLGRDARCAHLPLRLLAERLADAGYPALRYDHLDSGDSADLPAEIDATVPWLAGVAAAVDRLKTETGVTKVVLFGLRVGALLAALGARVDGLILAAPVVSGASLVRQLKLGATMGPAELSDLHGGLQSEGLVLSAATLEGLGRLDLRQADVAPGSRTLVISPASPSERLLKGLTEKGADIETLDFPDHAELFEDAHSNLPPTLTWTAAIDWLRHRFPAPCAPAYRDVASPPLSRLDLGDLIETPVHFGDDLWGVLALPTHVPLREAGVVFCNTGGDPRCGIGRFHVQAARRLARQGVASLRFDFAGLGDSPAREGLRSHIYETDRQGDLAAAVARLQDEGVLSVVLAGVCGGAHHVLHGSIALPEVEGAFMISPVRLVWTPESSLDIGKRDEGRATQAYMKGAVSLKTWRRLLAGRVDVAAVTRTLVTRLARKLQARDSESRRALLEGLARFSARGGRARFLMGVDDASVDEMETYFGAGGAWLKRQGDLSMQVIPGLDHGLMTNWSRDQACARLSAFCAEFTLAPSAPLAASA